VVCGKGAIFAEATTQPRLPHLDPTQIRKPEAAPARPVTLLSSFEQYAGFPKSPAQDGMVIENYGLHLPGVRRDRRAI
jgi:hypothetical protein